MSIYSDIKMEFKRNPLHCLWKLVWFLPAVIAVIITALLLMVFHLDMQAGVDFLDECM
jgi:uncharacterized membrane protein YbhN (UPF0104 family)